MGSKFSNRSTHYRQDFFKANKPVIGDGYFCAYCGSFTSRREITVDHLYPVNAAKRSFWTRARLKSKGFTSINDVRNLVPACKICNGRKGKKMGIWIIRGKIGRHQHLWIVRHIFRGAFIIASLTAFFNSEVFAELLNFLK